MFNLASFDFWPFKNNSAKFFNSKLHDETTFYQAFIKDLKNCRKEIIIESPFISCRRMAALEPIFKALIKRKIKIYIVTRHPGEQDNLMKEQAEAKIYDFEMIGVHVIISPGYHHRKLAILDRKILWEGSLNILSQSTSREIMRRIDGTKPSSEMFKFLKLGNYIY
ncbi:MAG: phospholipase D-like domain-containing protein [Patescibacteria group bacterium]|nr:phospholipase D-like domain-containing protein [Patescibacteria group bacterium]